MTSPAITPCVLVVEDQYDAREALSCLLKSAGYSVVSAASADEAVGAVQVMKVDVVLSDVGLGRVSGLTLMRELKQKYGLKGIAVTGYGAAGDVEACKIAGFDHVLIKPCTLMQIESAIMQTIHSAAVVRPGNHAV